MVLVVLFTTDLNHGFSMPVTYQCIAVLGIYSGVMHAYDSEVNGIYFYYGLTIVPQLSY